MQLYTVLATLLYKCYKPQHNMMSCWHHFNITSPDIVNTHTRNGVLITLTDIGVARNLCWGPDNRGAKGAKIETPKALRGKGMGRGCPLMYIFVCFAQLKRKAPRSPGYVYANRRHSFSGSAFCHVSPFPSHYQQWPPSPMPEHQLGHTPIHMTSHNLLSVSA